MVCSVVRSTLEDSPLATVVETPLRYDGPRRIPATTGPGRSPMGTWIDP